jgi:hypothetical protein
VTYNVTQAHDEKREQLRRLLNESLMLIPDNNLQQSIAITTPINYITNNSRSVSAVNLTSLPTFVDDRLEHVSSANGSLTINQSV